PGCGQPGCSGGVVDMPRSFRSGRNEAWYVDDLQLHPVGVVEEHRVVPRDVRVFLRFALELHRLPARPIGTIVDLRARVRLEREVVEPDGVPVVRLRLALCLAQADGRAGAGEVPDRLPALA